MMKLVRSMPTVTLLMKKWGLDPANKTLTTDDQEIIDNLKMMLGPERKTFTERRPI